MAIYLTGLLIDCAAVLALGGYYLYYMFTKKELDEPRYYFGIVITSITAAVLVSLYFIFTGNLENASILVWIMAAPVLSTLLFIILIIIFRPDWR